MLVAAILSAAIGSGGCFEDEGILDAEARLGVGACTCDEGRDWFSFALLIFEVNLIVVVVRPRLSGRGGSSTAGRLLPARTEPGLTPPGD